MRRRQKSLLGSLAAAAALSLLAATPGGAGQPQLILGSDSPSWSPDAQALVFVGFRNGRPGDIYVKNTAGGRERRLTTDPAQEDAPRWSPDGSKIAFVRVVNRQYQIFTMNADGSGAQQLTTANAGSVAPAWSPDGTKLAFVSNRDGNTEIYVMNADGSGQTRLTVHPSNDNHPAWSPDGSQLLFTSNRLGTGAFHLWIMRADGSQPRKFTDHPLTYQNETRPTWSPDGSRVAFVADRDPPLGNTEVYVVNGDGTDTRRLTRNTVRDDYPSWSPDGRQIAVARGQPGRPELYVLNAEGRAPRKVTGATLRFVRFAKSPRVPRAGTTFVLELRVRPRLDQFADQYCIAAVRGRPLELSRGRLVGGRLRCSWWLPRSFRGRVLRAFIGLSFGGSEVSRMVALRIR